MFKITFKKSAEKQLKKIPKNYYIKISEHIVTLATNPYQYEKMKGCEFYKIRIGMYRVIYNIIESEITVDVVKVGHRKDVYKTF